MLSVDLWNIIFTVVNLLVLTILVRLILFKPVNKIIEQRRAEEDSRLEEARKKTQEADDLKVQYEQSLAGIDDLRDNTVREAKKTANVEYQRIVEDAKDEAETIRQNAVSAANVQKEQIINSAKKDIADIVKSAAQKAVAGSSGAQVDEALYDEFIKKAGE